MYDVKFMKSVIHSVASLTYNQGQAMMDAPDLSNQVSLSINLLGMLARKLRAQAAPKAEIDLFPAAGIADAPPC